MHTHFMHRFRWQLAQFFEAIWWYFYLTFRNKTKYLEWKKAYWNAFLKKTHIPYPLPTSKILDIGCGPSGIYLILNQNEVTAVDPLLHIYMQHGWVDILTYPNATFHTRDFESVEISDSFDLIFCINAINHVRNAHVLMQKMHSFLKDEGTCVVSVDAHRNRHLKKIFQLLPLDILHPYQHSIDEYESQLISAGFQIKNRVLFEAHSIFDYYVLTLKKSPLSTHAF